MVRQAAHLTIPACTHVFSTVEAPEFSYVAVSRARGTWNEHVKPLRDDADPDDVMALFRNEGTLIFEGAWTWEIEGRRYDLDLMHQIVAQARLADVPTAPQPIHPARARRR
jgi:hypothetical protein